MNTLGSRQDDLKKKVDLTNELILKEQIERENDKKKKRTEMKFPKFNLNLATDSCHGRVSGINNICFLCSSYCRSQATAV